MTGSTGARDFFALEAGEYIERMDALLAEAPDGPPEADAFGRSARALRGAATMARQAPLAELAAALEVVSASLRDVPGSWTRATRDAVIAAVDAFKTLLRATKSWDAAADELARARTAELRGLDRSGAGAARRPTGIVPVARLFHDDAGPHVLQQNPRPAITADQRFRQAAVPLASTLRRLIGEARNLGDEGARRAVGDDLRAAIRDLGELAESYAIRAVSSFAVAREALLGALDERTLEVVDGAAQALVESAGTAWARATPPSSTGAIDPIPTAPAAAPLPVSSARQTPPMEVAPSARSESAAVTPHTPPTGQALVALLETSITGLNKLGDDAAVGLAEIGAEPAPSPVVAVSGSEIVPIDSLVYRGRAALVRAREIGGALRGSREPDAALLAELYDLLDLAPLDEIARA